jgi:putative ABC transport system ATP-binding protein
VLLADEPTGNLDSARGEEIIGLLQALNAEEDLSVVLITHDPAIAGAARRVVRLRDGRIADVPSAA